MEAIKIEVTGNIAKVIEKPLRITAGTVGLPVEFVFDSHWDNMTKVAVFNTGIVKKNMKIVDNATVVPIEALAVPELNLSIGVYGVSEDGSVATPTVWASVGQIRHGAVPGSSFGSDIGTAKKYYDLGEQAAEKADASAKKAESEASVAENAADRANASAKSAEASAALAGEEAEHAIIECTQQKNAAINARHYAEEAADRAEAAADRAESAGGGGGSAEDAVTYTPQNKTKEEKAQARKNVDALADTAVCVSYEQPTDPEAQVWVNPAGAAGTANERVEASSVSGIVGLALNEMLNNTAARYATIEDALTGNSATADGKVLSYTCCGALNIMLLDDIASATTINIKKDCTLHLNGKTLSFTAAGAYLNINTASKVTINGEVSGSEISKNSITSSKGERLVSVTGTHLTMQGGKYTMADVAATAAIPIRTETQDTEIDMIGCTVVMQVPCNARGTQFYGASTLSKCHFSISTTDAGNVAGVYSSGTELTLTDSTIEVTLDGVSNNGAFWGVSTLAKVATNIERCTINVSCNADSGDVISVGAESPLTVVKNCMITAKATAKRSIVQGIYGYSGSITISDCHIEADGWSDTYNAEGVLTVYSVYPIFSRPGTTLTVNGGHYWGARDGLAIYGTARINGGVFEGCQHGGAYMAGSDIKAQNAIFRNVEYKGTVGWEDNSHGGALYCGNKDNNDVNVYFDNCRFESNCYATNGIVAKETDTEVFLSNCVIDGDFANDLRADETCTIYVGKNVQYDTILENGTIDTTTYAGQEFGFETETTVSNALLSVKDERGNWIAIA